MEPYLSLSLPPKPFFGAMEHAGTSKYLEGEYIDGRSAWWIVRMQPRIMGRDP